MDSRKISRAEEKAAIEAALVAGKLIKKRLGRTGNIRYKGKINIVTEVDEQAEEIIVNYLKKRFPGYGILAEERPLEEKGENKWIIDPLDGTTNFAHSFPFFATSIALEKKGKIVSGVVYDPVRDELFHAAVGKGAYIHKKKIVVSKTRTIDKSFLATGFSYSFKNKKENNIDNFSKFLMASLAVRRAGSACLDLCYVAAGRFDGFWEMDLFAWDTAAASLIVREAGGMITDFKGKRFSVYGKNILASNGCIHGKMVNILKK